MTKSICFVVDSLFSIGGVQRVTAVIAKELARYARVTIVTFDNTNAKDTALYGLSEADICYRFFKYPAISKTESTLCRAYSALYQKCRLNSRWASTLYGYSSFPPTMRHALTKELRQGHYDVIVGVHAPLAGRLATMKRQLGGAVTVGWIHNSFEALFGKQFIYIGEVRKRHYVYQFRRLDHTVLLCHHDAKSYAAYDPEFEPAVIYNPLTLRPAPPSEGHSKRFLAVGRFSYGHKGFDLLIEAFHLFAQQDMEWCLDIVGEGPEEEMLRSLIEKYNLESRVCLHPFTTDIQSFYHQAQVYVLSSRWEGFGLVLVEAMAHGLPVVSSDLPTSKEIMGDFGLYFKNGDAGQLAHQLQVATSIDWTAKSAEALQMASKFSVSHIIEQWKTLLGITSTTSKQSL